MKSIITEEKNITYINEVTRSKDYSVINACSLVS